MKTLQTKPDMTKKAELQLIPAELSPVLQDTKIELSKAESHARAFAPSMQGYIELAEKLKGLSKDNPTDTDAKIARENRLKMVKVRTSADEIKDLRKEGIKAEGDLIQALYNVVKNSCLVTENEFAEIEKFAERKEQERQTALAEKRIAELAEFETDTSYLPLAIMTDEQYNRLIENEKLAFNSRKEVAEKVEAARIEAERLAEEKRLADIEADRLSRIAQAEENERLRKEKVIADELLAKEREAAAKEAKRLADISEADRKKRDAELAKEREASAKLAEELRLQKEAKDKELADEKARIEAEKAEKSAREKAALAAPDKEKVRQLHTALKAIVVPEFETKEGREIGKTMREALEILIKGLVSDSKKLL